MTTGQDEAKTERTLMAQHSSLATRLGWTDYLGSSNTLSYEWLLGRYPVKVQFPLIDALQAMEKVLIRVGYENPCDYIGSYMLRTVAGTDYWSNHAYGIAIDLDYGGDTDGDGDPSIDKNPHVHRKIVPGDPGFGVEWQILEDQVRAIEAIKNTDGQQMWSWHVGWALGDTMHWQINVSPQATQVDWSTTEAGGNDVIAWYDWVEGWARGLAEDPAKTEQELTRLNTVQQPDGGYILEPANNPATVQHWMSKLNNPADPEWRGFYARTQLSVWGR